MQINFVGTDWKNMVPGKTCFMKANVRHWQNITFAIKEHSSLQFVICKCLKTFGRYPKNILG